MTARAAAPPPVPAGRRARRAAAPPAPGPVRPWRLLLLACLALAALSLIGPSEPTYDPWSWIIWGRETLHGDLVTTSGPSWKPLPWLFTTPFALLGDAAPDLWLLVARAGGLFALVMAFRLAARLEPGGTHHTLRPSSVVAGLIAAGALLISFEYVRNAARGNSEPLMVALALWAVERHLDGRRRDAFWLLWAAGLIRPELWPVLAIYGLWLILPRAERFLPRAERSSSLRSPLRSPLRSGASRDRIPWRDIAMVLGAGVVLIALWTVPEYLGSGDFLRAASRALSHNPNSPAFAEHPFLEVFKRSYYLLTPPIYVGALVAVGSALVVARRERRLPLRLTLAATAVGLMVLVGAMTEANFGGNLRYVALPAAIVCVLGGAGWADVGRWLARTRGTRLAAVACVVAAAGSALLMRQDLDALRHSWNQVTAEAALYAELPNLVERAGGVTAVRSCGTVFTTPYDTPAVAWNLRMHLDDVAIFPFGRGTTLAPRRAALARDPRYVPLASNAHWVARTSCSSG